MDPLSVTASVAGIAGACLATAKTLNDLRSKYKDAQMTIAAICAETMVIGTTLAKIQGILLTNPQALTKQIQEVPGLELEATFDIALTGCSLIYSCLEIEVQKLKAGSSGAGGPDWKEKAKFLWKEDTMKDLLGHLRGQQASITLLISVLQIETVNDIHQLVKEKSSTDVLENTAIQTRSLRAAYPQSKAPQSIFDAERNIGDRFGDNASIIGSSVFEFDDDVVNSQKTSFGSGSSPKYGDPFGTDDGKISSSFATESSDLMASSSQTRPLPSLSSTQAYRRCSEAVMGLWASATIRKFRYKEYRFEVIFETPVIFVAPPMNCRGPIANRPIQYIDGSPKSYEITRVLEPARVVMIEMDQNLTRVGMTDDERASWLILLTVLQRLERESREWDDKQRFMNPRPQVSHLKLNLAPQYGLVVGLQRNVRSWDFMPNNVLKPYATSALCHLVEIAAMLGIYWKAFDQSTWNLRAQGNGMLLDTTILPGLGIMATFSIAGRSSFSDRRVIPCEDVKQLIFGTVPNIFEDEGYLNHITESQSLGLEFGTANSVQATLKYLGCPSEAIERYQKDHTHIFSLSFEIIGMLANVFRIRGSNFRMIPNPTNDPWLKRIGHKAAWNVARLMLAFQEKLRELLDAGGCAPDHPLTSLSVRWQAIAEGEHLRDEVSLSLNALELIHDAIDKTTLYIFSQRQTDILRVIAVHLGTVLEALEDPKAPLNSVLLSNKEENLICYYFCEIRPATIGKLDATGEPATREEKDRINVIWCSLVFRMLCWLLLHDFDRADINIVPPGLKGSRVPVFIT